MIRAWMLKCRDFSSNKEELAEIIPGKGARSSDYRENGIPYLRARDIQKGDIVTVHNLSLNTITIMLGTVPGTGTLTMQLDSNCSMSFICIYSNSLNYVWSPLGNVTVSIT